MTDWQQENAQLLAELHRLQEELEHQYRYGQECAKRMLEMERKYRAVALSGMFKRKRWQRLTDALRLTGYRKLYRVINAIKLSGEFDYAYYTEQYSDALGKELDPVEHYVRFGVKKGYNPSPYFDTRWYLQQYPDVAKKGMNPLFHYIQHGRKEGRQPGPSGIPELPDPFQLEREWLRKDRDEQARLAEERAERIKVLESEIGELTGELHRLQESLERELAAKRTLEAACTGLEAEKAALEREMAALTSCQEELTQRLQALEQEKAALEQENRTLERELAAKRTLEAACTGLEAEKAALEREKAVLEQENRTLGTRLSESEQALATAKIEAARLRQLIDREREKMEEQFRRIRTSLMKDAA